jgi:hypothetical protein
LFSWAILLGVITVAKFPGSTSIRYTNASPSGQSTGVTAHIDVRTGQEFIGDAVAHTGNVVYDQGAKIQVAEDAAELSTLDRQAKEIWNAAEQTIQTTTDPDTRKKVYDKAIADMGALKSKRASVNGAYQEILNDYVPRTQARFNDVDRTLRIRQTKDEIIFNGQSALETGDLKAFKKLAATGLNTGVMSQAEYDAMVKDAPMQSTLAQARIKLNTNPEGVIKILEGLQGLSGEQLDRKDQLVTMAKAKMQIDKDALRMQQDEDKVQLYELVQNKSLTWDAVKNSSLSADDKIQLWEDFEQKIKTGKAKIEESDPVIEAQLYNAIALNPQSVSEEMILSRVGLGKEGGLSGGKDGTAAKLIAELRSADTPEKQWRNAITTTGNSYLKDLEQAGVFGTKNTPESAEKLANTVLKWQAWRQEHKDASQEEGLAYLKQITLDDRKKTVTQYFRNDNKFYTAESAANKAILDQLATRERKSKTKRQYAPLDLQEGEPFKKGQTMTKNGITYTYAGNGKWSY